MHNEWNTALLDAAETGNLSKLSDALHAAQNGDAYIDIRDANDRTPLIIAAMNGHLDVVDMLLKAGADVHLTEKARNTALMGAAFNHQPEITEKLIAVGSKVNAQNINNKTALIMAAKKGDTASAKLLLEAGANPNLEANEKSTITGRQNTTALEFAVSRSDVALVDMLIEAGANPCLGDALRMATERERPAMLHAMVPVASDLDIIDINGMTALNQAVKVGNIDIARYLLASGANPEICGKQYDGLHYTVDTPLHRAIIKKDVGMVTLLLAAGADLENLPKTRRGTEIHDLIKSAKKGTRPTKEDVGLADYEFPPARPKLLNIKAPESAEHVEKGVEVPETPESRPIRGDFSLRIIEANTHVRAEHDALNTIAQKAMGDRFIAELACRCTVGEAQQHLLDDARVTVSHNYESGPEPVWTLELAINANSEALMPVLDDMSKTIEETLGRSAETSTKQGNPCIEASYKDLGKLVEAFNATLSEPIPAIDMSQIRAAAQAEMQTAPQSDLAR